MNETREELEAERDFLLRSLDDLESELLAGNIDPDTYRELHDDYTARASAVIRSLDGAGDRAAQPVAKSTSAMRWVTGGAIVVFCVLAAFLLARAAGEREPGQTLTGNSQTSPRGTLDPNSYEGHLAAARAALQATDYPKAFEEYTKAAELDPSQPEPVTYRGWISVLGARAAEDEETRATLLDRAAADFEQAIATSPDYPDAYFFKGFMLYQVENKPAEAIPALQKFLVLSPQDHPQRNAVLAMLENAQKATSTTTTP